MDAIIWDTRALLQSIQLLSFTCMIVTFSLSPKFFFLLLFKNFFDFEGIFASRLFDKNHPIFIGQVKSTRLTVFHVWLISSEVKKLNFFFVSRRNAKHTFPYKTRFVQWNALQKASLSSTSTKKKQKKKTAFPPKIRFFGCCQILFLYGC